MDRIHVLLVDHYRQFLDAAADFLAEDPQIDIVACVCSTKEALELIPVLQPDVVLMELDMPEISGLLATVHIKAMPLAPKVIIVTHHGEPAYRTLAEAVHVDGFISKRAFGRDVVAAIKILCVPGKNQRSQNTPEVSAHV